MKTASSRFCLRCDGVELAASPDSAEDVAFYECPRCRRRFAQRPGRGLCERWPGPLGLVLYGVIFERHPPDASARVAARLLSQKPREEIRWMLAEVERELDEPTQEVRDILETGQKEEDVRAFLGGVVEHWRSALE